MFAISFTSIFIVLKQFFPYHPVQKKKAMVKMDGKCLDANSHRTRENKQTGIVFTYTLCVLSVSRRNCPENAKRDWNIGVAVSAGSTPQQGDSKMTKLAKHVPSVPRRA